MSMICLSSLTLLDTLFCVGFASTSWHLKRMLILYFLCALCELTPSSVLLIIRMHLSVASQAHEEFFGEYVFVCLLMRVPEPLFLLQSNLDNKDTLALAEGLVTLASIRIFHSQKSWEFISRSHENSWAENIWIHEQKHNKSWTEIMRLHMQTS